MKRWKLISSILFLRRKDSVLGWWNSTTTKTMRIQLWLVTLLLGEGEEKAEETSCLQGAHDSTEIQLPALMERLAASPVRIASGDIRPSTHGGAGQGSGLTSSLSTQLTVLSWASPFWKIKVIRILTHIYRVWGMQTVFRVHFELFTMKSE